MRDLDEQAVQARGKKAAFGQDIDLETFQSEHIPHNYIEDLRTLPEGDKTRMLLAGVDAGGKDRSGTYVQKDTEVLHISSMHEGLEIMPIKQALKECDWIKDYYWNLVSVDMDKYTAKARLDLHNGYVIRALPGSKVVYPVQACLYMDKEGSSQHVHNIIIAEELGLRGCGTPYDQRLCHVSPSAPGASRWRF